MAVPVTFVKQVIALFVRESIGGKDYLKLKKLNKVKGDYIRVGVRQRNNNICYLGFMVKATIIPL